MKKRNLKEIFGRKIKLIKNNPYESAACIVPIVMLVISVIYALITYNAFKDNINSDMQFTEGRIDVYLQCIKIEVLCFIVVLFCLLKGKFKQFKFMDKSLICLWWVIPVFFMFSEVAFLISFVLTSSLILITIKSVTQNRSCILLVVVNVVVFWLIPFYLLYLQNEELFNNWFLLIIILVAGYGIFGVGPVLLGGGVGRRTSNVESMDNTNDRQKDKCQKKVDLYLNTVFWVDRDIINTPCVYYKNNIGAKSQACTVYEFEKGEVAIYNKGNRIMSVPGCKTPER